MAGALKRILPTAVAAAAVVAASLAVSSDRVMAQSSLSDPTRPPAALEEPAAAAETKPGKGVGVVPQSGLQTVIMRKGHKPVAVINGETVELGGKLGEATLVRLSEREAVLQGPQGKEVLRLTPNAEKTPANKGVAGAGREVGR